MLKPHIPFNKPTIFGKELYYIEKAVKLGKLSGNGLFTNKCQEFLETKYGFKKVLLTNSCTSALEMSALLLDIKEGDEVIVPSFTFVSTANAFALHGAKIVFADCDSEIPNIDANQIENLITVKTKAIVIVHYAGIACKMDDILEIVEKHNLCLIEDAAMGINSTYKGKPLGTFGHLSAFSFHETKNVISGEGGMLAINSEKFINRAEILWEKGTNRIAFFKKKVEKYEWVDIGSSYLPSEITAAFLYAQLERIDKISKKRARLYRFYVSKLDLISKGNFTIPKIPDYASLNGHMFYIICNSNGDRDELIKYMKKNKIDAIFHYLPLHQSQYYKNKYDGRELNNTVDISERILRLPLYYRLSRRKQLRVIREIKRYFRNKSN